MIENLRRTEQRFAHSGTRMFVVGFVLSAVGAVSMAYGVSHTIHEYNQNERVTVQITNDPTLSPTEKNLRVSQLPEPDDSYTDETKAGLATFALGAALMATGAALKSQEI